MGAYNHLKILKIKENKKSKKIKRSTTVILEDATVDIKMLTEFFLGFADRGYIFYKCDLKGYIFIHLSINFAFNFMSFLSYLMVF